MTVVTFDLNTTAEQALFEAVATYSFAPGNSEHVFALCTDAILGTLRPQVEAAVRAFYGPAGDAA